MMRDPSSDPNRRELAEKVEMRRHALSSALSQLEVSLRTPLDLRARIAARPWGWTAAALVLGFWIGVRTTRRP